MIDRAKHILKTVFGYDQFISLQQDVIENILRRRDTLVIMPTGGGKSLCYQIPALVLEGLTIVVSPLISLMKDQVEQLTELAVPAVLLNSTLSSQAYRGNVERIRRGEVKLLYVAPETLLKPMCWPCSNLFRSHVWLSMRPIVSPSGGRIFARNIAGWLRFEPVCLMPYALA